MLDWIVRRCEGEGEAAETAIGLVPPASDIDTDGIDISTEEMEELLSVDADQNRQQLHQIEAHLAQFGGKLPQEIRDQLAALEKRLEA